jgi:hypothetical protein
MSEPRRASAFPLQRMTGRLLARPLDHLAAVEEVLPATGDLWGFFTTAAEARLGRHTAAQWRSFLRRPGLVEARIFDEERDVHWLAGRGLFLVAAGPDADPAEVVGGEGWLQRDRRSRLWGEWLAEAGGWYEERIPHPQCYSGLAPGPENNFAFLVYREYVCQGAVRYVRYLRVEGEPR